jgi:hypothetical protein
MNKFSEAFFSFPEESRPGIPVIYNCIYRFDKKGLVKKKGDRYFGVPNKALQTPVYYPWGHEKPISRALNFSAIETDTTQNGK